MVVKKDVLLRRANIKKTLMSGIGRSILHQPNKKCKVVMGAKYPNNK